MERSNQPPKPECCLVEGEGKIRWKDLTERRQGSVHREKRGPQAGHTSCLSNSASKLQNTGGDELRNSEPKMDKTAKGEVADNLSGSERVAREEEDARNWGGPEFSRRTNYESQAGKETQRKEVSPDGIQGFGSIHSTQRQGEVPEAGKGIDTKTQPAQETSTARMAENNWQTFLRAIAKKAREVKHHQFGDLYRWLNEEVLRVCFYRLRKDAASGVDGVSFQDYEKNLEANLTDLVGRLKRKAYRAKLVRRKYIPKSPGKRRPLGIPTLEEKLLQSAVTQILMAIYEEDFLECSYGYRPGRGPHDAVRALTDQLHWGNYNFVVEADIKGFFDNIQHDQLLEMLEERIDDGALLGLIRKWLRAGILEEDGKVIHPETGTPQGGIVSPMLANVYLHCVLDRWFEAEVQRENRGRYKLCRFADDFVTCFEYRHEAVAFERALKERLAEFGQEVAEEKTQMLRFGKNGGHHNGRFNFLGFEFRWEKDRKGRPTVKRRTARKKFRAGVQRMREWIKSHRSVKLPELMKILAAKLRGTWNYYGLIGNGSSLNQFYYETCRTVFYWLNRRSQRGSYTWSNFTRLLHRFKMPKQRIMEKPKQQMPCQQELSLCQRIAPFPARI